MPRSLSCRDCLRLLRESPSSVVAPELAAHLAQCPDCAREQRLYVGVSADLRAVTLPPAPLDLRDRVRRTLQAEDAAQAERKRSAWYLAPWLLSGGAATATAMLIIMVYLRAPHSASDMANDFSPTADAPSSEVSGSATSGAPSKLPQHSSKGQQADSATQSANAGATHHQGHAASSQTAPALENKPKSSLRFAPPSVASPNTAPKQQGEPNSSAGVLSDSSQTVSRGSSQKQAALSHNGSFRAALIPPIKTGAPPSTLAHPKAQEDISSAAKPVFLATLRVVSAPNNAMASALSRTKTNTGTQNDSMRAATAPAPPGGVGQEQGVGTTSAEQSAQIPPPATPSAPTTNSDGISGGFGAPAMGNARGGGRGGFGGGRGGNRSFGGARGGGDTPSEAPPPQGSTNSGAAPIVRKVVPPPEGDNANGIVPDTASNKAMQGRDREVNGNSSLSANRRAGSSALSIGEAANGSNGHSLAKRNVMMAARPQTKLSTSAAASTPLYGLNVGVVQAVLQVNPTRDVSAAHLDLMLPAGTELLSPLRGQAGSSVTVWRGTAQRGKIITIPLRLRLSGRGNQNYYAQPPHSFVSPSQAIKLTLRGVASHSAQPGMEQVTIVASQSLRLAP